MKILLTFNRVLNFSKENPAVSDVVFARNVEDITDKVLALLNATKPPADEHPAASGLGKEH